MKWLIGRHTLRAVGSRRRIALWASVVAVESRERPVGESASFDHFILTRFSAVFREGLEPPAEEWLRFRLELFRGVCCPSVRAQTVPVRWLVFFDDRCSREFRAEVEQLANGLFEPVWTHVAFDHVCQAAVGERARAAYVITTRLDSDDAIACEYAGAIQAEFAHQDLLYLSFPRGLQIDRAGTVYRYTYPSGPFISLIERRRGDALPRTVLAAPGRHREVRRLGPLREVQSPAMWLQLVHDGNIANSVRGVRVDPRALDRFELEMGEPPRLGPVAHRRAQATSLARLVRFWSRNPYYAAQWLDAMTDRVRGTHTKPRTASTGPALVRMARSVGFTAWRQRRTGRGSTS